MNDATHQTINEAMPAWITYAVLAFAAFTLAFLVVNARYSYWLGCYPVRIVAGPYAGKEGNVVSIPWLGNGYNLRATVNVQSEELNYDGTFKRAWVKCWSWELEKKVKA